MAMDRLRNTVPCTPGRRVGVVTAIVAAASRGYILPVWLKSHPSRECCVCGLHTSERGGVGRCCWREASLLVLRTVDLACIFSSEMTAY